MSKMEKIKNDELHNLYFTSDFCRVTTSRRIRLGGQVAHMVEAESHTKFSFGNLKKYLFGK